MESGYDNPMSQSEQNTFKVVQLNAENLFLFLDDLNERDWRNLAEKDWQRLSSATVTNKSLVKTLWLADSLLDMDADIVCLNEVGGEESIANFARIFLKDRYTAHLLEGNSDRGIDIGYLIKRGFPLRPELRTHKNRPLGFLYPHEQQTNLFQEGGAEPPHKSHYFSRDCAELRLFSEDPSRPALVILLVHLKSKLDPDNIDPQGKERRRAEVNTLVNIYQEVRAEFSPPVPMIVTGDFNGNARPGQMGEEFARLGTTDLESVVEVAGLSEESAATQFQFNRGGGIQFLQIDFIFVSPDLRRHLIAEAVEVFRYRSDLKIPLPLPKTLEQRTYMPSDHYPVVAVFKKFF
jgi:endonuclease/exonuclease/phosphatase family metal-dependent hydrolase